MPDLITIQGSVALVMGLTDIATLQMIDETDKILDSGDAFISAFADAPTQATVQGRGLTVTVIKTEAEYNSDLDAIYAAINNTPYDTGGIGNV
jgi:hypothetical protein